MTTKPPSEPRVGSTGSPAASSAMPKPGTGRAVLRLVKPAESSAVEPETKAEAPVAAPAAKPGRRPSALVQMMTAYADAIDRDIRLILEI